MMARRQQGPTLFPTLGLAAPVILTVLALAVCGADPARLTPQHRHPGLSVLILFSDDQRADTIAALGNPHIRTPNLDRLVRSGHGVHPGLLHGLDARGGMRAVARHAPDRPDALPRQGRPHGPAHLARGLRQGRLRDVPHRQVAQPAESALRAFQAGKAIFFGGMGDPYNLPFQDISPQHTLVKLPKSEDHSVKRFADAAVEFLRGQSGAAPFLCYVAFNAPHDPRLAPRSYHDWYNAHQPPLPENFLPRHPFDNGALEIRDEKLAPWPRTPEVVRQHLADYYAAIEHLDAQVGRILDALEASGQAEKTLVVFTSDHGLAIGSHGLFGKQNLYDHSMRSPLIVAGPGIPGGPTDRRAVLPARHLPHPGRARRRSGPRGQRRPEPGPDPRGPKQRTTRDSIFTAYADLQRAVRDERWKLIVYPKIKKTQLFDLWTDPGEMHDLAEDSNHTGELERLIKLLRDWQSRLDDPQPRVVSVSGV